MASNALFIRNATIGTTAVQLAGSLTSDERTAIAGLNKAKVSGRINWVLYNPSSTITLYVADELDDGTAVETGDNITSVAAAKYRTIKPLGECLISTGDITALYVQASSGSNNAIEVNPV